MPDVTVWQQQLGMVLSCQVLHHVRCPARVSYTVWGNANGSVTQAHNVEERRVKISKDGSRHGRVLAGRRVAVCMYCIFMVFALRVYRVLSRYDSGRDLSSSTKMVTAFSGILGEYLCSTGASFTRAVHVKDGRDRFY